MEFLLEYGLFLAKSVTVLVVVLVVISGMLAATQRRKSTKRGHLEVTNLNEEFEAITNSLKKVVLNSGASKRDLKAQKKKTKEDKQERKQDAAEGTESRPRLFVIDFHGDLQASGVTNLREEITAVLSLIRPHDEVLLRLESPGGTVHGYGLAASQLQRLRNHQVQLTIAVDKVAASGGYMMACIGNKVIAAPFAVLGSIGVVAQLPNFHRLLKKNEVDFEVLTAGEYKRTLTVFGENTEAGRTKFLDDLEDIHALFKDFVVENRPLVDITKVATGEAWYGKRALERALVDELQTSDEYLVTRCQEMDVFHVEYVLHLKKLDRLVERLTRLRHAFMPAPTFLSDPTHLAAPLPAQDFHIKS